MQLTDAVVVAMHPLASLAVYVYVPVNTFENTLVLTKPVPLLYWYGLVPPLAVKLTVPFPKLSHTTLFVKLTLLP